MDPASPVGMIKELTDLYGGGLVAAVLATLLVVIAALFAALMLSMRSHLRDARSVATLAEKMTATVEGNTRVLGEAGKALHDATVLLRATYEAQKSRVRGSSRSGVGPVPIAAKLAPGGSDGV